MQSDDGSVNSARRGSKEVFLDFIGGATGAGIVLVLFPAIALYHGILDLAHSPEVGLPLLAIFGIMILFGAMALVSTLFERLGLANRDEALALPKGSVRAAIALSLIVLFAIISIMLFQFMAKPYIIKGLSDTDKIAVLKNPANRVLAVVTVKCEGEPSKQQITSGTSGAQTTSSVAARETAQANTPSATTTDSGTAVVASASPASCYDIHLVQPPAQESIDLAKQLLILIGTLMTSSTAYYFAAQSTVAAVQSVSDSGRTGSGLDGRASQASIPKGNNPHAHSPNGNTSSSTSTPSVDPNSLSGTSTDGIPPSK